VYVLGGKQLDVDVWEKSYDMTTELLMWVSFEDDEYDLEITEDLDRPYLTFSNGKNSVTAEYEEKDEGGQVYREELDFSDFHLVLSVESE
jgi:hypothetical protein